MNSQPQEVALFYRYNLLKILRNECMLYGGENRYKIAARLDAAILQHLQHCDLMLNTIDVVREAVPSASPPSQSQHVIQVIGSDRQKESGREATQPIIVD